MNIIFTNIFDIPEEYHPRPASSYTPSWYKNMESYVGGQRKPDGNGSTTSTIKRCMPVFDAISSGYIIPTYTDLYVSPQKDEDGKFLKTWYEWSGLEPIHWHPIVQAPEHPNRNGHELAYPKWMNPWSIKTPKGYSCLFVQPFHRESEFTILPGVVDTDTYTAPVNLPFVLNSMDFDGIIPAGSPMVQVIPFKRDQWSMKKGSNTEIIEQEAITQLLKTKFFDGYKNIFRQKKEYR